MGIEKDILMQQFNSVDYDALYPLTKSENVSSPEFVTALLGLSDGNNNVGGALSSIVNQICTSGETLHYWNSYYDDGTLRTVYSSTNRSAYPDSGTYEGYKIVYAGVSSGLRIPRMQIVSYVGTGASGENSPCQVTFSFAPKLVFIVGFVTVNGGWYGLPTGPSTFNTGTFGGSRVLTDVLGVDYMRGGLGYEASSDLKAYTKKSTNGKTITWYIASEYPLSSVASYQYNTLGYTYYVLGLG